MRTWTFVGLAAWLALVSGAGGCVNQTPMAQITAARVDAAAAIRVVIVLYAANRIDDETAKMAVQVAVATQAALDTAEAAVELGQPADATYYIRVALSGLRELIAIRIQAERSAAAGATTRLAAAIEEGVRA